MLVGYIVSTSIFYLCTVFQLKKRPSIGLLTEMTPVNIVSQPIFEESSKLTNLPDFCFWNFPSYGLLISTTRLCSLKRVEINSRIVVVGASNTGFAFLEKLFYNFDDKKRVIFNNVTLVYTSKLSSRDAKFYDRYSMFVYRGHFSQKYVLEITHKAHVNYVRGMMTEITR